ncbi:TonB-dependent receptor [Flagellimonas sp. S3867]|uniref:TonB-dependent receptor n=1 Tax=Flagellimonas sp. S3867 TaxID=2768063 RepID=UPI00168266BB|nr:TonB-dependent receptor [Flagellimonas sp. S3867]
MRTALFLSVFCYAGFFYGQQNITITGFVKDKVTEKPIHNTVIYIQEFSKEFFTDTQGRFQIETSLTGEHVLNISSPDFVLKRLPLFLENQHLDLGIIFLEKDLQTEKEDNLIALTEGDLSNDGEIISGSSGLLQSTRDVFLSRAAFDFGQAFFRVRGYDSRNGIVMLNGIPMNKLFNGRPQWNNWGGLNDVTRNQEFTNTLSLNRYTFGGLLGSTNIDLRPSQQRPGTRLSSSISNRTYRGRIMATYNSGQNQNGLAYTFSSSRRWASSGYVEGTLYDAYSFFGAAEYKIDSKHSISLSSILAKNRRGRSAAITDEVYELIGNKYNPYWGNHNDKMRNSRERQIFEPLFLLNYFGKFKKWNWNSGVAYQFGSNARSRLGYFNAPSPDPTYYRYLPSFYLNSPIGADFTNAGLAKSGFLENSALDWASLYRSNANNDGKAAYVFYDDISKSHQLTLSSAFNYSINEHIKMGFGLNHKTMNSENYAEVQDLLGAQIHEDLDTFSNTRNDLNGNLGKVEKEKFSYNYYLNTSETEAFGQLQVDFNKVSGFASIALNNFGTQREGLFQNERFLENSLGKSEKVSFSNIKLKGGTSFFLSARHWFTVNGALMERSPTMQNIFINPRENNEVVPEILSETINSIDMGYHIRLPDVSGRISAYYTRFQNTTDINFFYVESGLGSDFVQEAVTALDKLHRGIEFGMQYEVSSSVKLSAAGNLGQYVYASDPRVQINFDTSGEEEDLINLDGNIDLGIAKLKGIKLAQGPQTAFALGVEYRSPKYWWAGATTNYLAGNHVDISTIRYTDSFLLDPDTGERFLDATDENVGEILKQQKLNDFYLLNLVGGKSWLLDKKYVSAFLSINNLFDEIFKTGGYQQGRNGNYAQMYNDNLGGTPSFGPKYWFGFGRTYFLNLAVSF